MKKSKKSTSVKALVYTIRNLYGIDYGLLRFTDIETDFE